MCDHSWATMVVFVSTLLHVKMSIVSLGTNPCTSGNYQCEEGCPSNWTKTLSSRNMKVSKDLCLSEQAVIKYRNTTNYCSSKGLFCKNSIMELLKLLFCILLCTQINGSDNQV